MIAHCFEATLADLADEVANQDIVIDFVETGTPVGFILQFNSAEFGTESTSKLDTTSVAADVQAAMEGLRSIEQGDAFVVLSREELGPAPGGGEKVRLTLTIYRNGGSFRQSQELVTLQEIPPDDDPMAQKRLNVLLRRHVAAAGPTRNELDLIGNEDDRTMFADDVLHTVQGLFSDVASAIDDGDDPGSYTIDWTTGGAGEVGLADKDNDNGAEFQQLQMDLLGIVKSSKKENQAKTAFRVAQRLSQYHDEVDHVATIYVDKHFTSRYDLPYDATRDDLIIALAQTVAHELGHMLGLFHSGGAKLRKVADEVQKLTVGGGAPDDTYRLEFAGAKTELIRRDAGPGVVQDRLRDLEGMDESLTVTGPPGGPYTVSFVPLEAGPTAFFRGVDVPQIQQSIIFNEPTPVNVQSETLTDGISQSVVTGEIYISGQHGIDDIMSKGRIGDVKSFLSSISLPLLKMALREHLDRGRRVPRAQQHHPGQLAQHQPGRRRANRVRGPRPRESAAGRRPACG